MDYERMWADREDPDSHQVQAQPLGGGYRPGLARGLEPVSPALQVVRAARPVLRGVQWLANRVLGEKRTDLGVNNQFRYDTYMGKWTLASDPEETEVSAASGTDDDGMLPPHLWQQPIKKGLNFRVPHNVE